MDNIELNSFLLEKIGEPHVVVFNHWDYLVVSIESLEVLRGKFGKFRQEEVKKAMHYIGEHRQELQKGFEEMVERKDSLTKEPRV
ncbi:MAG: hypothetical protein ACP5SH_09360 [Syntrophobacteraceae bacterium]